MNISVLRVFRVMVAAGTGFAQRLPTQLLPALVRHASLSRSSYLLPIESGASLRRDDWALWGTDSTRITAPGVSTAMADERSAGISRGALCSI